MFALTLAIDIALNLARVAQASVDSWSTYRALRVLDIGWSVAATDAPVFLAFTARVLPSLCGPSA